MTEKEILQNPHLLKRFCKDTGIPVNLFKEPYFTERLHILNPMFSCVNKWEVFIRELQSCQNEQDYLEEYNKIKDFLITDIKENPAYQKFIHDKTDYPCPFDYPSKDCYNMNFHEKYILSIDMKKANFSALSVYDPAIFHHVETWEDFISDYTESEHIIKSKYIRQVIMGACNPKRQVRYEKYLMTQLLTYLMLNHTPVHVASLSNDELILSMEGEENVYHTYNKVTNLVEAWKYGNIMRVQLIYLQKLPVTDGWLRTVTENNTVTRDFKKLNSDYYHQAVKWLSKEPLTKNDLVLCHDKHLVRLLEPVFPNMTVR